MTLALQSLTILQAEVAGNAAQPADSRANLVLMKPPFPRWTRRDLQCGAPGGIEMVEAKTGGSANEWRDNNWLRMTVELTSPDKITTPRQET
jgi:hypothetical protein